jgi:hypothetical protein
MNIALTGLADRTAAIHRGRRGPASLIVWPAARAEEAP